MSLVERGFLKIAGVKRESDDLKWYAVTAFSLLAKIDHLLSHPFYEGDPLPQEGPALIIGNHPNPRGFIRGYRLGEMNHRIIRTFAKNTLFDYHTIEPEEVWQRTGKKQDLLNVTSKSPWWHRQAAKMLAAGIKGLGSIPVARGGTEDDMQDFLDKGEAAFQKRLIVGIFGQETRSRTLANPMIGPATLAMENYEVPIYAVAMLDKGIRVRRLGTFEELWNNPATHDLADTNLTVLIFNAIADMSDPEIRDDWYQVQRPKLLPPSLRD